jgi:hypothetical protein
LIAEKLEAIKPAPASAAFSLIVQKILSGSKRPLLKAQHFPTERFAPGKPLTVQLKVDEPASWAKLYYRHVNQAERFKVALMERKDFAYSSDIPVDYTSTSYPIQYYFEVKTIGGSIHLYPGFQKDLTSQPYFVVRRR